jgi:hypothetical protein
MRNLSARRADPAAQFLRAPATVIVPARPEYICKLVLSTPKDRRLIEAVGGYPARLQSCVLAAWLRRGWRLVRAGSLPLQPVPPLAPSIAPPAARLTRRIRFDDPADPTLAGFLRSLPRKERGREIRHFISTALQSSACRPAG